MNLRALQWPFMVVLGLLLATTVGCASSGPQRFSSPEQAAQSLVDALRTNDETRLDEIFGPEGQDILSSGDAVADRADRDRFLALYDENHRIESSPEGERTLLVGQGEWPFPVPIASSGRGYVFDSAAGRDEILNRRIGRNELSAQQVCRTIVEAQREYVALRPMGADLPEYAQKFISDPGKKNGLYWPTSEGEPPSPLGPLVGTASAEGYGPSRGGEEDGSRRAYHGYRYRLLTSQGSHAKGGEMEYLVNGRLIGGFGVVAYPVQYGNSGIMSFIVNHDGVVYERDLGPDTESIAARMDRFDPGPEWTRSPEVPQLSQGE